MGDTYSGLIIEVDEVLIKTELNAAAASGDTVLYVYDSGDFEDDGGVLMVKDVPYAYLTKDDEESTITLGTPLTSACEVDEEVYPLPQAKEKEALVDIDEEDEAQTVRVPHSLRGFLMVGIREEDQRESVTLSKEKNSGEWVLKDLLGIPNLLVDDIQIDNGDGTAMDLRARVNLALTTASQAIIDAGSAMAGLLAVYYQNDPPVAGVGGVPNPIKQNSVWFDINDGYRQYVRNPSNTAWVPSDSKLTGVTLQTSALPNVGLKFADTGFAAYGADGNDPDNLGDLTFYLDANTGLLITNGPLISGAQVTGSVVTGGTVQTTDTAARGLKMTSSGLVAYDGVGNPTFTVLGSNGSVAMSGALLSGGEIAGALLTGDGIRTSPLTTVDRVLIDALGLRVINSLNQQRIALSPDGFINLYGNDDGGGTVNSWGTNRFAQMTGGRFMVRTLEGGNFGFPVAYMEPNRLRFLGPLQGSTTPSQSVSRNASNEGLYIETNMGPIAIYPYGSLTLAPTSTANSANILLQTIGGGSISLDSTGSGNINIGSLNTVGDVRSLGIFDKTSASAANVRIESGGSLRRVSSSIRYKEQIEDIEVEDITVWGDGTEDNPGLRSVSFYDRRQVQQYAMDPENNPKPCRIPGRIAEEVKALGGGLDLLVEMNEENTPEALSYDRELAVIFPALKRHYFLTQDHNKRLPKVEAELAEAQAKNKNLEDRLAALEKAMNL